MSTQPKLSNAIIWSVIIHSMLLLAIALQVNWGAAKKQQQFTKDIVKQNIIAAKLVINQARKQPEKSQEKVKKNNEEVKPIEREKATTDEKVVAKKVVAKPIPLEEVIEPLKEKIAPPPIEKEQRIVDDENNGEVAQKSVPVKTPSTSKQISTLEMSRRYIQQHTEQAPTYQNGIANAGMSMMNNDLPVHNYEYIEEKSIDEKSEIRITCDSTLKSVSVAISASLLGGTLRCQPGPDLTSFIKQKKKPKFKYKLDQ
ncbi:hypothetical protein ACMAZF_11990 [Psychrobium sp. nBUS_13]|uniref:hypothetical protein n=1 Tax=Psychrobium sp. nBUS_13 TaxID=3395319 RepID=UPI003EBF3246